MLLILTAISLFIIIYNPSHATLYDENNTIEHQATVIEVIEKEKRYEIIIEEYPASLSVAKSTVKNEAFILELKVGDHIIFRIPDFYDEALDISGTDSVLIVSLNTYDISIFTLEDYNNTEKDTFKGAVTTGAVFSGLFICGAVICFILLIKDIKSNKSNKSKASEHSEIFEL